MSKVLSVKPLSDQENSPGLRFALSRMPGCFELRLERVLPEKIWDKRANAILEVREDLIFTTEDLRWLHEQIGLVLISESRSARDRRD